MTVPAQEAPTFDFIVLDDLAEQTYAAVLAVWLLRPQMDEEEWIDLVVRVLVTAIVQAEQWGRLYGEVTQPVDGNPLLPVDDVARRPAPEDFEQRSSPAPRPDRDIDLIAREAEVSKRVERAVRTLAVEANDLERLERLARDEPIKAAQRGYQDGARLQSKPSLGYRRGINPDCCELCFWLWKEGYVYPIDQPMHRHIGCRCVPVPTTDPPGKWSLRPGEKALLEDLYGKYVIDKRSKTA